MIALFTVLILSVILLNGLTDASSAVSSCVSTRSLSPNNALCLAAVCNFSGSVLMAILNSRVAQTVFNIVHIESEPDIALTSLCAGLCAVIIWSLIAFRFGIPTSETHALLAGISGAVFASTMSLSSINFSEWLTVIYGLFLSTLPAFLLAGLIHGFMIKLLARFERRRAIKHFMRTQKFRVATSSFMHGAQESQKFMGVFMLGFSLITQNEAEESFELPLFVILSCAAVMMLGTLIGGGRIIKKVGMEMVTLDAAGGSAADMACSAVLALCSLLGIPVSTNYTKVSAMMGVGVHGRRGKTDKKIAHQVLLAWILTFPICAIIGFILARYCL